MNENIQQQDNKLYKESNLEQIAREALVKEVGGFFDTLIGGQIVTRSHVKKDFHMDYATIQKLREGDSSISKDTLEKVTYVIAYYLVDCRSRVEGEENGMEKMHMLKALDDLEKQFEKISGYLAHFLLEKAKQGINLRQVVKHE